MKNPVFTGVCTALITPFRHNGSVDYAALSRLIERQIEAGVDAICLCGTTGESAVLTAEEQRSITEHGAAQIAGRCKLLVGSGSNDTRQALALSLQAQKAGADALLQITPYYNKTSQQGLIRHYEFLADRCAIPLILYHVPGRTGQHLSAETVEILARHPKINGMKDATGDLTFLLEVRARCGEDFSIWSGEDNLTVPMMTLGARGVVSVLSNLVPEAVCEMCRLCLTGKHQAAGVMQIRYAALVRALFSEGNPIPVKAALQELGLDAGYLRLPLWELAQDKRAALLYEMEQAGLGARTSDGEETVFYFSE